MSGVPFNMLKHLKEECSNISKKFCNILYDLDNINNKTKNNKRSRVEAELSDDILSDVKEIIEALELANLVKKKD
ncbi:hypothetical protein GLOIN_2v1787349 [Rhizophagus irregularis DAOM 181602=DAOM 197198]|uniref:Uncharacterized protein n=1 Tax=Rhizophagus irregularis (strain DAOM 181602 / DAOM 197198 / MUCL 43194) TaxID=747089 RepID=A0A2P4P617_RHIID|nr:hypothetical protein GLOIN_2v1787349 [Rhizophagus irregularis DAOM 181602=DAOM 197198]POG60820.1 hypothetical protein GLOIN_2v1787349 [Rhizophagus irregularis DAOM 181602=DAOM 197198]|eukprot:XP_025167686.1 hypothetical protein GLOIN_2v1787349 [Rhizophagus irregularis DAOM 181602=DAOM 197198]